MSRVLVPTRLVVGLVKDLLRTAHTDVEIPELCTVLLHTDRSEVDLDGPSDVLVGTSTDTTVFGQAHEPCEGRWHRPVLLSSRDAKAIGDVFTPLVSSLPRGVTHRTVLEVRGPVLSVSEDPEQVPNGKALSLRVLDDEIVELFPDPHTIGSAMSPDRFVVIQGDDGGLVEPSYGTGVYGHHLSALGAISKRRCMPLVWYRHHQSRGIVVTVGSRYRAVLFPYPLDPEVVSEPGVGVFLPVQPPPS